MTQRVWMVRAGRNAQAIEDFLEKNAVAVGWPDIGDLSNFKSPDEMKQKLAECYYSDGAFVVNTAAGMLARFVSEMKKNDIVVTYNPSTRRYHVGTITGDYRYEPSFSERFPNTRSVEWKGTKLRDDIEDGPLKNSLGAIQTLFNLDDYLATFEAWISDKPEPVPPKIAEPPPVPYDEEVAEQAGTMITDVVMTLGYDDLPRLVAGVLRAMGYHAKVTPPGPDRGVDVIGSPDPLGFEEPRIKVEVKHRKGQLMGAPEVRNFIAILRPGDRGMYLSTGGFSKEARYEAERSQYPVTLLDLDDFVELLVDHYDNLDPLCKAMVPLTVGANAQRSLRSRDHGRRSRCPAPLQRASLQLGAGAPA